MIPLGTRARIDAGDSIEDVMPSILNAKVGQILVLENRDNAFHTYGPVSARPGETIRWRLSNSGEIVGYCTIGDSRTITIRVSP